METRVMSRRTFAILAFVFLSGCASNKMQAGPDSDREVLMADEIEKSRAVDAYDAIRKLRANFLSYRGRTSVNNTSSPDPIVYVDDQAYGPISSLRNIPAAQIAMIRLYRSWEATSKFGTGHMGGVIAVSTKQ
jgi:hypothetical protein